MPKQEKHIWDGYREAKSLEEFITDLMHQEVPIVTTVALAYSSDGQPQKVMIITEIKKDK